MTPLFSRSARLPLLPLCLVPGLPHIVIGRVTALVVRELEAYITFGQVDLFTDVELEEYAATALATIRSHIGSRAAATGMGVVIPKDDEPPWRSFLAFAPFSIHAEVHAEWKGQRWVAAVLHDSGHSVFFRVPEPMIQSIVSAVDRANVTTAAIFDPITR